MSSRRERSVTSPAAADGVATGTAAATIATGTTAASSPTCTVASELSEYRRRAGRAAIALLILTTLRPDAGRRRPDIPDIVGACEG